LIPLIIDLQGCWMFNANGYLEPGLHIMTVEEFQAAFVTPFPHSTTRSNILVGYVRHRSELVQLLDAFEQFVDGSFTTNKNDPNDVDLLVMADGDLVDALSPDDKIKLTELVDGKATQGKYLCDAYFLPTYPDTHPMYVHIRPQRKYWMGEFGFDRCDVAKGIIHMQHKTGA